MQEDYYKYSVEVLLVEPEARTLADSVVGSPLNTDSESGILMEVWFLRL